MMIAGVNRMMIAGVNRMMIAGVNRVMAGCQQGDGTTVLILG